MPVLGLTIQALPPSAEQAIIKEWGALGVMMLFLMGLVIYLLKRSEAMSTSLQSVITENTKAIARNSEVLENFEERTNRHR